jgi:Zn-dependent protease
MFGSLKLGKLFGIDLFVHGTFWLLPLYVFVSNLSAGVAAAGLDVAVVLTVFACVALHEVGHALAARGYGITTRDITLTPIGGIARLERMPEGPGQEIVVALAGPLVNVLIAVVMAAVLPGPTLGLLANLAAAATGHGSLAVPDPAAEFVFKVWFANVILCLFNLIPAFPMDGGRVFRALLSTVMNRVQATRIALGVSSILAVGFFLVGWQVSSVTLMILAPVIYLLGRAELAAVRAQALRRERARWDPFVPTVFGPPPADPFSGWRWDPVRRVWSEWVNGVRVREVPAV